MCIAVLVNTFCVDFSPINGSKEKRTRGLCTRLLQINRVFKVNAKAMQISYVVCRYEMERKEHFRMRLNKIPFRNSQRSCYSVVGRFDKLSIINRKFTPKKYVLREKFSSSRYWNSPFCPSDQMRSSEQ